MVVEQTDKPRIYVQVNQERYRATSEVYLKDLSLH